jgi:ssDNA-binding Zn-finger/Zn-ribbon topoisomerase 1
MDRAPAVAEDWHPTLNGDVTPHDVFAGSDLRIWWSCHICGYLWRTKISKRTQRGQGCPQCAVARRTQARAQPAAGQSLMDEKPDLGGEWHPTLNSDLTPADVRSGSSRRVWWRCKRCQHEWATPVRVRAQRGGGCPTCAIARRATLRSTPRPGQSFGDLHPEISDEWHPTRNRPLKPTDVKPASHKRVWWLCRYGHEWEVAPAHRRRGEQCPRCAIEQSARTRSTPTADTCLAALHPDIASEWHPTKNDPLTAADVNPGSPAKRWWQCRECHHDFQVSPSKRTLRGDGCPKCRYQRLSRTKATPKPGESLAEKDPELAEQWHPTLNTPLTPYDVRPRGRASVWWKCPLGHEWKAAVAPRAHGVGCPKCSTVGVSERQVRLAFELAAAGLPVDHLHPPIPVTGRRPVRADIVMPALQVIVEYDGSFHHANKIAADRIQTAALESAGWTVLRVREEPLTSLGGHEVSVAPTEPIKSVAIKTLLALAKMNYAAANLSAYIADPQEWAKPQASEALYRHRTKSIASDYPNVATELDPAKNDGTTPDQVHPGSNTKFCWTCAECGHEWWSMAWIRTAGHGCPRCSHYRGAAKRATPEANGSFGDLFPQSSAEWHPTRNQSLSPFDVRPGSGRVVWWLCKCGREWQARVADRRQAKRCPDCFPRKRRADGTWMPAPESGKNESGSRARTWFGPLS